MAMGPVQPELALGTSSLFLIVLLGLNLIALSLVSMWKERRHGQPLKGIVRFALAIIGFYAVIVLLTEYVQKARSSERVSHRGEAATFGWNEHEDYGDYNPSNQRRLVRAYVGIVFDNCLMIREKRVIRGPMGLFVSIPAKSRDETHRQLAYGRWLERET